MNAPTFSDEQIERARARLLLYSGLDADRALIEEALAHDEDVGVELADGYVDAHGLRDAVAQVLTGDDWPAPDALAPIAEAAKGRNLAFTPVADGVTLSDDEHADIRETVLRWYDVICFKELALDVFRQEPDLYADFVECNRRLSGDTMLRETFLEIVATKLVGRGWPLNMDPPEAVQAFHKALEGAVRPGYFELNMEPDALVRRAGHRHGRKDHQGALELLEQVLSENPVHRDARLLRAFVRRALGSLEFALHEAEALAGEHADFMPIVRLRGLVLAELGRKDEAIPHLERFVAHYEPQTHEDGRVVRRRAPSGLNAIKELLAELRG